MKGEGRWAARRRAGRQSERQTENEQGRPGRHRRPRHHRHRGVLRGLGDGPGLAARGPDQDAGQARQAGPAGGQARAGPEPVLLRRADRRDAGHAGGRRLRRHDARGPAEVMADPAAHVAGLGGPGLVHRGDRLHHLLQPDPRRARAQADRAAAGAPAGAAGRAAAGPDRHPGPAGRLAADRDDQPGRRASWAAIRGSAARP